MSLYQYSFLRAPRPAFLFLLILLLFPSFLLSGCSGISEDLGLEHSEPVVQNADELAILAMADFNVGRYHSAITKFEEIIERYPFSPRALLAELKAADCHYYMEEYLEGKLLYQEFIKRHPTNEAIPYVMFQIGMCDLNQTDRIDRNITGAKEAIQSFSQLLRAFPDSPYSKEAQSRILAAKEFLVNHEFFVAVFYVRTEKYSAAEHRLNYLITTYPDALITPKAKKLLQRLKDGDPPKIGISSWLPDVSMPEYTLFPSDSE
jgi:outer membrane protein assembly factor BamD